MISTPILETENRPIDPYPQPVGGGITEEVLPWAGILVAQALRGDVQSPMRDMSDQQLRYLAANIGLYHGLISFYLEQWELEPLADVGFWPGVVLPAILAELERRKRPKPVYGDNSLIARLKRLDIVDVARRFTELTGNGNRLRGRCPLHQERTGSFYVYLDTNRWRCYGACASGGDIIDLIQRLRTLGRSV